MQTVTVLAGASNSQIYRRSMSVSVWIVEFKVTLHEQVRYRGTLQC